MLEVTEIKDIIAEKDVNITHIARKTALSYKQIWGALKSKNPKYYHVKTISDFLESEGYTNGYKK